jgi:hypothetical protein
LRNFALGCIGLLALVAAFHLGALSTSAGSPGIIGIGAYHVIMQDGRLWTYVPGFGWGLRVGGELPFPPSELALFDGNFAVDGSGSLWQVIAGTPYHWEFIGQPPGSAAIGDTPPGLKPSSWGRIKSEAAGR